MVPCDHSTWIYILYMISSFVNDKLLPTGFEKEVMNMWETEKPYTTEWYEKNSNIEIKDHQLQLQPLYNFFCEKVKSIYNKEVIPIQRYWACIHTNEFTSNNWHNHLHSSDVNGVYYITKDCEIHLKSESNEIMIYHPKQYELIIFPSWVDHMPVYKEGHRMSLNIECNLKD